jgi:hypothetical protein
MGDEAAQPVYIYTLSDPETGEAIHALREYIHNADKTRRRKATHGQHGGEHCDGPTG